MLITNQQALLAALPSIRPGTTVQLAPGDYTLVGLRGLAGGVVDAPVTFTSADADDPARITELNLRTPHVTFSGLWFDYVYRAGQPDWYRPFQISSTVGASFLDCLFDGDLMNDPTQAFKHGWPSAFGLGLTGVKDGRVERCTVRGFMRGLVVGQCDGLRVRENDVYGMRSDGMNYADVDNVLIEGNHIHDFLADTNPGNTDHRDFIQFWTNGTRTPGENITIRGNMLFSTDDDDHGEWAQSIFMRNEEVDTGRQTFEVMAYRNVLIENNLIMNSHLHGITVGETDGLTIRKNVIMQNPDSIVQGDRFGPTHAVWEPRINIARRSRNVTVDRNVAKAITGLNDRSFTPPPDWVYTGNMVEDFNVPSRRVGSSLI